MANPELGQKQLCPNCQAKFYDLNRHPARCPKCATEFDPMEEALKSRRVRRGASYAADTDENEDQVADKSVDGDEEEEDDGEGSTPEIDQEGHEPILTPDDDDADPADDEANLNTTDGDDDDVLDDDDDSVPFIEDEDDDGLEEELTKPSLDDE